MANFEPAAIANEFRDVSGQFLGQKKIQRLTYISNGWHLAISGFPLINEEAQAWDNGPIFKSLWDLLRDFNRRVNGYICHSDQQPIRASLNTFEKDVIKLVWQRYGNYSGDYLSDITHQPNTPWTTAYFGFGRDAFIPNDTVKLHFLELANAEKIQ